MPNINIKNVDKGLYDSLLQLANLQKVSIEELVLSFIRKSVSIAIKSPEAATKEFLAICGTWEDDKTAEEMIKEIRQSRRSGRRFNKDFNVFD